MIIVISIHYNNMISILYSTSGTGILCGSEFLMSTVHFKVQGPWQRTICPLKAQFQFRYNKKHLSRSKYFPILPMLLTEKNADLHILLTCLDNIRCESTITLISWAAGVANLIQPPTSINTRKSSAMKARAQVMYLSGWHAKSFLSFFYFPPTEVATCSPRLPIFSV